MLCSSIAAPLLLASMAGTGGADDGICPTGNNCHFPRWSPAELANLDEMGEVVATNGTQVAVGAPGADAVFIYERSGTQWTQVQRLDCPTGTGADFGSALDMDGTRLVVGARLEDTADADAGAVFVYQLVLGSYSLAQGIFPPAPVAFGYFGESVGIDGSWLAVGSPGHGPGGRVIPHYSFDGIWTPQPILLRPGTDELGSALTLQGTDLLVGDYSDDDLGANAGAVHYWELSLTSPSYITKIYAPDGLTGDQFGYSLDLDDNWLVVGAWLANDGGVNSGTAYVFRRDSLPVDPWVTFEYRQELQPCGNHDYATFGRSVSVQGERVAVGAPGGSFAGHLGGFVTVYDFGGFGDPQHNWTTTIYPEDGNDDDRFGLSTAILGEYLVAGAPRVDQAAPNSGAAYMVSTTSSAIFGGECPCDTLATIESYGAGKPGTNGVPELTMNKPPVPGDSTMMGLYDILPGTAPVLLWGLTQAEIPFDGGTLLMADPHMLLFPVAVLQQVGMSLTVPPNPAFCGISVFFQAMVLDPGANGEFHTAQSAGIEATIGF